MIQATNASVMKEKNKKLVLDLIRRQHLSRAELSKLTGLTKPALSTIVEEMLKENVVLEYTEVTNEVGRRPIKLYLNRSYRYFIGVNVTRNSYEVGVMDLYGEILAWESAAAPVRDTHAESVVQRLCERIAELLGGLHIPVDKVHGIGFTTPGPVNKDSTTILAAPNFNPWHHVNIGKLVRQKINVPVYLENISNAWALCEKYFGAMKDISNFIVLKIDEGIGSGIMLGGRLFQGLNELGHTTIKYDGIPCECGNRGCLEKYASIGAILKNTPYKTWQEAVDAQDTALIEKEAEYLVPALVNASNLFSLEAIVLASDISYKAEQGILNILNREVGQKSLGGTVNIVKTKITSSIQSAAVIALDHFFHL